MFYNYEILLSHVNKCQIKLMLHQRNKKSSNRKPLYKRKDTWRQAGVIWEDVDTDGYDDNLIHPPPPKKKKIWSSVYTVEDSNPLDLVLTSDSRICVTEHIKTKLYIIFLSLSLTMLK